jgi:hypothetical protein
MSQVYDRLRDSAEKLVKDFGRPIRLSVSATALADPAKPWGSNGDTVSTTTYLTTGAFVNEVGSDLEARLSAVSRLVLSPVEVNEARVVIAAKGLTVVPSTEMQILDGSRTLEVKKVETVAPGDVAIMYVLKVEN